MKKVGIYNPYLETKGGGERVCLALASALAHSKNYRVSLISHTEVDLESLANYFNIDLSGIDVKLIDDDTAFMKILRKLPLPGKFRSFFIDMKSFRIIKNDRYDVFVNNCYQSNLPNPSPLGVYMCMFPQKLAVTKKVSLLRRIYYFLVDGLYRIFLHPRHNSGVFSYQLLTANSRYTQSYITEYWKSDSEILYPVCDSMYKPSVKKQKIILHVGRFFENSGENHHKKQDVMLDAFSKMKKLHKDGWELHFAGSVAEDVGALKYILKLIKHSKDLPVQFHFNSSYEELKRLFNESTVYWHATGFGSDSAKHPEKQEHFGITTVEAMSAKAVPIVINSAGQKESVTHGVSGYLWDTPTQLADYTTKVSKMSTSDLEAMRTAAAKTAQNYGKSAFEKRVLELFDKLTK